MCTSVPGIGKVFVEVMLLDGCKFRISCTMNESISDMHGRLSLILSVEDV